MRTQCLSQVLKEGCAKPLPKTPTGGNDRVSSRGALTTLKWHWRDCLSDVITVVHIDSFSVVELSLKNLWCIFMATANHAYH